MLAFVLSLLTLPAPIKVLGILEYGIKQERQPGPPDPFHALVFRRGDPTPCSEAHYYGLNSLLVINEIRSGFVLVLYLSSCATLANDIPISLPRNDPLRTQNDRLMQWAGTDSTPTPNRQYRPQTTLSANMR